MLLEVTVLPTSLAIVTAGRLKLTLFTANP